MVYFALKLRESRLWHEGFKWIILVEFERIVEGSLSNRVENEKKQRFLV